MSQKSESVQTATKPIETLLHFEICRNKMHVLCQVKNTNVVLDLKRIVEGVLKIKPEDQQLFKGETLLENAQKLGECGFDGRASASAVEPALVKLAIRKSDGKFASVYVNPVSVPPPLEDLLRPPKVERGAGDAAEV